MAKSLRVYCDADVLIAGCASDNERAAPLVLLTASEITLLDLITSDVAIEECRRNLHRLVTQTRTRDALRSTLESIVHHALDVVPPPPPSVEKHFRRRADAKDAVHLACAVEQACPFLITWNLNDYHPGHEAVTVLTPGALVRRLRAHIKGMQ